MVKTTDRFWLLGSRNSLQGDGKRKNWCWWAGILVHGAKRRGRASFWVLRHVERSRSIFLTHLITTISTIIHILWPWSMMVLNYTIIKMMDLHSKLQDVCETLEINLSLYELKSCTTKMCWVCFSIMECQAQTQILNFVWELKMYFCHHEDILDYLLRLGV